MPYLYLSTDAEEARCLIQQQIPYAGRIIDRYHEIDMHSGADLAKRVGFNPMSSLEFNPETSDRDIEQIIISLVRHKLFVTLEVDGVVIKHRTPDMKPVMLEGLERRYH